VKDTGERRDMNEKLKQDEQNMSRKKSKKKKTNCLCGAFPSWPPVRLVVNHAQRQEVENKSNKILRSIDQSGREASDPFPNCRVSKADCEAT
jgi:hypothetical protein